MMDSARIVMLASLLAAACGEAEPVAVPPPTPKLDRPTSVPTEPTGSAVTLRWTMRTGDTWEERNTERMFLLAHPKGAPDPDVPALTITRTERFEVLASDDPHPRVRTTVTHVTLEVREEGQTRTYRSDEPSTTPDALSAREFAYVGVPLETSVSPLGTVSRIHDFDAHEAAILARFDVLASGLPDEDRTFARKELVDTLARQPEGLRTRGLRPVLPHDPAAVGSRWVHPMDLPSLMESTVHYGLVYSPRAIEDDQIDIELTGTGTINPSAMLSALLESSEVRVSGSLRIDPRRGVLVDHDEALHMRVEFRDGPVTGGGGVMESRLERRRVRLEPEG